MNNDNIFWSENVEKEFNRKYNYIFDKLDECLSQVSTLLINNNKEFLNQTDFEKYIISQTKNCKLDYFKKMKVIEFFWQNQNIVYGTSPNQLMLKFNSFLINFLSQSDSNKKDLEKLINLHPCGLNNYKKYGNLLYILKEIIKIHYPDYKIVLDAHDFALTNDVNFVTTDEKLYQKLLLSNVLAINNFSLCN